MAAKNTAKKPKPLQKPDKERALDAALSLAARMGWDMVTLSDIAAESGMTLAELSDHFEDKTDILVAYGRAIDKKVLAICSDMDPASPERDRLFEILMERFDVLSNDREAVVSILKSFTLDPKQAVISLPHLGRSMAWMLEAAGIDTSGVKGAIRVAGLAAVYLNVLRQWVKDESEDLSRTMAALDKNLSRAEQCATTFML
jgi:AcrR family transcriptional regulator